jgi:AcrR family transcriptional regulator
MGQTIPNHRTAVGAKRRQLMVERLVAAAFRLVAQGGVGATTIDGVIVTAGVSRGTFYKYFESPQALLQKVSHSVSDALLQAMHPVVKLQEDPAHRIAVGVRTVLRLTNKYPLLAGYLVQSGWPAVDVTPMFSSVVSATLAEGIERGNFSAIPLELAQSTLVGTLLGAIQAMSGGAKPASFAEAAAEVILRGLGIAPNDAYAIARMPLPTDAIDFDAVIAKLILRDPVNEGY